MYFYIGNLFEIHAFPIVYGISYSITNDNKSYVKSRDKHMLGSLSVISLLRHDRVCSHN